MSAKRLPMRYLREILRLRHAGGLSQREIARSLSLGVGTVCGYLAQAAEAGLGWPLPAEFDDGRLKRCWRGAPLLHAAPADRFPIWPASTRSFADVA